MLFIVIQVSEESAEAWVDEFATSGPDFQQAKAAVEVRQESVTIKTFNPNPSIISSIVEVKALSVIGVEV